MPLKVTGTANVLPTTSVTGLTPAWEVETTQAEVFRLFR